MGEVSLFLLNWIEISFYLTLLTWVSMILPVDGSQFSLWYFCVLLCCSGVETFCSRPFFRSYFVFIWNDALIAPCCKQLVLDQCDVNQCAAQEGICRHVDVLLWPGPARPGPYVTDGAVFIFDCPSPRPWSSPLLSVAVCLLLHLFCAWSRPTTAASCCELTDVADLQAEIEPRWLLHPTRLPPVMFRLSCPSSGCLCLRSVYFVPPLYRFAWAHQPPAARLSLSVPETNHSLLHLNFSRPEKLLIQKLEGPLWETGSGDPDCGWVIDVKQKLKIFFPPVCYQIILKDLEGNLESRMIAWIR